MKKYRLNDLVVPWGNGEQQRNAVVGSLILAVAVSGLTFWARLQEHTSSLYDKFTGVYIPDASMPTYTWLMGPEASLLNLPVFAPFSLLATAMVFLAVWNDLGFYRETKSIYLMKRLPNRWERHRRCLALPLMTLLACVVLVPGLTWLFYQLYLHIPPAEAIPPDHLEGFWANARSMFFPSLSRLFDFY